MKRILKTLAAIVLLTTAMQANADCQICSALNSGFECAWASEDGQTGSTICRDYYGITRFFCDLGPENCLNTVVTDGGGSGGGGGGSCTVVGAGFCSTSCVRCTYVLF